MFLCKLFGICLASACEFPRLSVLFFSIRVRVHVHGLSIRNGSAGNPYRKAYTRVYMDTYRGVHLQLGILKARLHNHAYLFLHGLLLAPWYVSGLQGGGKVVMRWSRANLSRMTNLSRITKNVLNEQFVPNDQFVPNAKKVQRMTNLQRMTLVIRCNHSGQILVKLIQFGTTIRDKMAPLGTTVRDNMA